MGDQISSAECCRYKGGEWLAAAILAKTSKWTEIGRTASIQTMPTRGASDACTTEGVAVQCADAHSVRQESASFSWWQQACFAE